MDTTDQSAGASALSETRENAPARKSFWRSAGPGFITAAVVIGPGTITVASKVGAGFGAGLVWALLIAGSFMMLFTAMSARIGALNKQSLLTLVATHYGRWLAIVLGVFSFTVASSFQLSNYLACSTALTTLTDVKEQVWMGVIGAAALVFVFAARQLYKVLEKVMMALVFIMIAAFLANLAVARPNPVELISGLVPKLWPFEMTGLVIAMVATTFSVIAALYQSTLAQQKGWTAGDAPLASREAVVGISALVGVSLVIMLTSATVLRGGDIQNASHLAEQLKPLLGQTSVVLFSLGFFAAGFSSTIVNAMIGGGLLADSLGFSSNINRRPTRIFTAIAMGVGLGAGFYMLTQNTPLTGIILAQKTTIVVVPLAALVLILLANDRRIVGEKRNSLPMNCWAALALLLLIAMSAFRIKEMLAN
jgi:manganese transport protein